MNQTWRLLVGDVRTQLRLLPEASVHCVVTSPPYWGLRDYGTASWDGGDPLCEHKGTPKPQRDTSGSTKRFAETRGQQPAKAIFHVPVREVCACGARRIDAQIGLEESPYDYVAALVEVFSDVRRVLRDDGLLWLNLGDCYANDGKWGGETGGKLAYLPDADRRRDGRERRVTGLKPKDLIGVPWRVAFALQADGWYLRQFMPWLKRNGMPESTEDRPTTTVESMFLLAKSERPFYDPDAVMKVGAIAAGTRAAKGGNVRSSLKDVNGRPPEYYEYSGQRFRRASDWFFESFQGLLGDVDGTPLAFVVNTKPYTEAHFATFPPELVSPCIRASTSEQGCCSTCGAPVLRLVERKSMVVAPAPISETGEALRLNPERGAASIELGAWLLILCVVAFLLLGQRAIVIEGGSLKVGLEADWADRDSSPNASAVHSAKAIRVVNMPDDPQSVVSVLPIQDREQSRVAGLSKHDVYTQRVPGVQERRTQAEDRTHERVRGNWSDAESYSTAKERSRRSTAVLYVESQTERVRRPANGGFASPNHHVGTFGHDDRLTAGQRGSGGFLGSVSLGAEDPKRAPRYADSNAGHQDGHPVGESARLDGKHAIPTHRGLVALCITMFGTWLAFWPGLRRPSLGVIGIGVIVLGMLSLFVAW